MGEPFEITYRGPFRGINTSLPALAIQPETTPSAMNFLTRSGRLFSRPRLSSFLPGAPDGFKTRGLVSFMDSNNVVHTCLMTKVGLYQLSVNWPDMLQKRVNPWLLVGNYGTKLLPDAPFSYSIFVNKLYFTNGGSDIFYWDGITNGLSSTGDISIYNASGVVTELGSVGGYFLMELNAHLILANTIEKGDTTGTVSNFPQRVRWSASGLPNSWDAATNIGAGYNDSLDTPDGITGIMPIGRVGYLFRTNGVTEITPVGGGTRPFDFNHLWAADKGIGSVFAQTVANYGSFGMFISSEGIYKLTPISLEDISSMALDNIYTDLRRAVSNVLAIITPYFSSNFIYPSYYLTIPVEEGTIHWLFYTKDSSWITWTTKDKVVTTTPRFVYVS